VRLVYVVPAVKQNILEVDNRLSDLEIDGVDELAEIAIRESWKTRRQGIYNGLPGSSKLAFINRKAATLTRLVLPTPFKPSTVGSRGPVSINDIKRLSSFSRPMSSEFPVSSARSGVCSKGFPVNPQS
jgi:hypothetical protein